MTRDQEKETRLGRSYTEDGQPLLNRAATLQRALEQIDAHFNNPNTQRKQYFAAKAAGTLPDPDQHLVDLLPEDAHDDEQDPWDII